MDEGDSLNLILFIKYKEEEIIKIVMIGMKDEKKY